MANIHHLPSFNIPAANLRRIFHENTDDVIGTPLSSVFVKRRM